ncbi:MAG: SpoIIE family protein phosphatase, partial [Chlorobi bacterium]|nr:SpoIIE family protein phosphatase [Chlorobiota bacterium]
SNEKQKILINNIPVHIYFKDINLRYILANNSYANLLGLTVNDIIGKTDDEISNSEIAEFYQKLDRQVIETKKPIIDLLREHEDPNGKKYWAKTSKMPYFGEDNKIKGVIGIVNDVTKQIENEQKMKLQTEILQNAHKDITDSISYAKTIQQALLPNKNIIDKYFDDYFVFYKPKEAVSGDFYYLSEKDEYIIFAVADCTGHGVPGGFLTMLGITYLNDIIKRNETDNVGKVLDILNKRIKSAFKYKSDNTNGLDIALCAINRNTNVLQYAGAYNPLWIIRDNNLLEYRATRKTIGVYFNEANFNTNIIQLYDNDLIYLFSDGYRDQIGGKENKKFLVKRFRKLLLDNHKLPMKEQEEVFNKTLKNWKGNNEQIDDITIMGIKWKIS